MGKGMSKFVVTKGQIKKFVPRNVSPFLQKLREFLLGHKHLRHSRYEPWYSPRSIPAPEIPHRGADPKYFDNYYFNRHALNSVKPPVVADLGRMKLTQKPADKCEGAASTVPTPGDTWWWDGHCYYEDTCENLPVKK